MEETNPQATFDQILARGRWSYILRFGVLYWGVTTAVLFTAAMTLLYDWPLGTTLMSALITFPIGGVFWGAFMWQFLTRRAHAKQGQG